MLLPNCLNGLHMGVTNHLVAGMIFQVRLAGARVGPGRGSRTFCTAEFVEAEILTDSQGIKWVKSWYRSPPEN